MSAGIGIAEVATTFGAGILTFISPCVLPIIPSYLVYISGASFDDLADQEKFSRLRMTTFFHSLMFVLGFSLIFVILGASATFIGRFLSAHTDIVLKVSGAVVFFFGLHLSGLVKLGFLMQDHRLDVKTKPAGFLGSFLVGLAFGAGWTPCVGPLLGTALGLASTQGTVWSGIVLLGAYAMGIGIPFIIASLTFNHFLAYSAKLKRYLNHFTVGGGIFLMIIGVLMFMGWFGLVSDWVKGLFGG
jgi:cytochrome c-type biogenesis protein